MTTAVASPPVPAPSPAEQPGSARPYHPIAPSTAAPSPHHGAAQSKPSSKHVESRPPAAQAANGAAQHARPDGRHSPPSSRMSKHQPSPPRVDPAPPVKIEPSSPNLNPPAALAAPAAPAARRHRPQQLNLTASNHIIHASGALTSRPPIRDGQDLALACLSPGIQIQDPHRQTQLQRSAEVRERQRQLIEGRNKQARGEDPGPQPEVSSFVRSMNAPNNARKKRPPPNLSIAPPSHQQFANERVIQSAPIHQSTFTGLRSGPPPFRQPPPHGSSGLAHGPPVLQAPATQTGNVLPPIADVLAEQGSRPPYNRSPGHSSHSNHQPPIPSPGFAHHLGQFRPPQPGPRREFSSAEEAARAIGGEEPRPVYYGGHQPPTPPSPQQKPGAAPHPLAHPEAQPHGSLPRRRGRDEYERDNGSPPLGRQPPRPAPYDDQSQFPDSEEGRRREFLNLCARAWDLMHRR